MTHPLTDDIIESDLATPAHFTSGSLVGLFTYDDMRAAYDLAIEHVSKWLEDNVGLLLLYTESELGDRYLESLKDEFIQDFKEAMRPQEDTP